LEFCGKAHLLDAMKICVEIWNMDSKYAKEDSIRRCWRKSGLLTVAESADMENDIGPASVPMKDKVISQEDCLELCNLFTNLYFKVSKFENIPPALAESLVEEKRCTEKELATIIDNWIDIEDDPNVIEDDVMEAIEEFEKENSAPLAPMLPSFDNFEPSFEELNNILPQGHLAISWEECFNSCEIIKRFLAEKNMGPELIAFETFQHKLRVKQINAAASQLLIKSFFQRKQTRS
jgi:hypothetical protein